MAGGVSRMIDPVTEGSPLTLTKQGSDAYLIDWGVVKLSPAVLLPCSAECMIDWVLLGLSPAVLPHRCAEWMIDFEGKK
jgi:hypothetical protein